MTQEQWDELREKFYNYFPNLECNKIDVKSLVFMWLKDELTKEEPKKELSEIYSNFYELIEVSRIYDSSGFWQSGKVVIDRFISKRLEIDLKTATKIIDYLRFKNYNI